MKATRYRAVTAASVAGANRSTVLRIIQSHGAVTQGEIARRAGLTTSAVSKILRELRGLGLVRIGDATPSTGGRPATLVELNGDAGFALGVNVGFTRLVGVAVDLRGTVVARAELPTAPEEGPGAVLGRVAGLFRTLMQTLPGTDRVVGLGVGVPGLVDVDQGISIFSPNLRWEGVPVRATLERWLGLPAYVDNDVRAAALAEHWYGAGRDASCLVALYVGSAIGSGIIVDGELYYGFTQRAGEVGHIVVEPDGPACSCGKFGCLEAVASGRAIAHKASRLARQGAAPRLLELAGGDPERVTAQTVAQAASEGERGAAHLLEEAGHYVGLAVASLINILNPQRVVIGGGVAQAGTHLLDPIRRTVSANTRGVPGAASDIVPAALGRDAGPRGAATLVLRQLFPASLIQASPLIAAR